MRMILMEHCCLLSVSVCVFVLEERVGGGEDGA